MVISKNIQALIQSRIEQEELSSRIYKAMSVWLDFNGYFGAAKLWKKYSEEETKHAEWAYRYLIDSNIKPVVNEIDLPGNDFKGLPQVIALSYKHELAITKQCNDLAISAQQEGDYMTLGFAQKYLKEQKEEIEKIQFWIGRLEAFGNSKESLRLLDNEMGCSV